MTQDVRDSARLSRQQASDAVAALGWRYVLGVLRTSVQVTSLVEAADVAAKVVAVSGPDAEAHLSVDLRRDCVVFTVQSLDIGAVTPRDAELVREISSVVSGLGLVTSAGTRDGAPRVAQVVEIAIDALDIAGVRPFWKAVMGYTDEPEASGPEDALVDPIGQGPSIWFQQMDAPRPQRNRIHFDISVPHDEAHGRIEQALAAGGTLLSDSHAPAFWVLADREGNEACITTWQGRDG